MQRILQRKNVILPAHKSYEVGLLNFEPRKTPLLVNWNFSLGRGCIWFLMGKMLFTLKIAKRWRTTSKCWPLLLFFSDSNIAFEDWLWNFWFWWDFLGIKMCVKPFFFFFKIAKAHLKIMSISCDWYTTMTKKLIYKKLLNWNKMVWSHILKVQCVKSIAAIFGSALIQ